MKLYEILPRLLTGDGVNPADLGPLVIEPEMTDSDIPMIYLSDQFLVLLVGDAMPDGNDNIRERDILDADTKKQVLGSMLSVVSVDDMTPEQKTVYDVLVVQSLDDAKLSALAAVKDRHAVLLNLLSGGATTEERDTWPIQKEIALRYLAEPSDVDGSLLSSLLVPAEITAIEGAGKIPAQEMAKKIEAKSNAMVALTFQSGFLKRKADMEIEAAQTVDKVGLVLTGLASEAAVAVTAFKSAVEQGAE